MTSPIPDKALAQHIAVLGKTGAGKTTVAKLVVEHVVKQGARVCILDPIKSDWWGLISSADGKHTGLPFQILGGPWGHVPLHAGAGKAIAGVVASGALPLSILDMSQFEAGGLQRFFADFAPVLIQKMRGVLYLVIEEAHEFAPKERAGFGAENMSIHYAKRIATAGRSKGIRMIVCTQRVQSLHNAVLGSCETMVALRFTAPADQEPIIKWLQSNVSDKALRNRIETSLADIPTGSGWVCSGEAKLFHLVKFPQPWTFDNTKTPDEKHKDQAVKTATVDAEKLRALIGDAVKEAERDDPRTLRMRIAELERELKAKPGAAPPVSREALQAAEQRGFERGATEAQRAAGKALKSLKGDLRQAIEGAFHGVLALPVDTQVFTPVRTPVSTGVKPSPPAPAWPGRPPAGARAAKAAFSGNGAGQKMGKAERKFLTVLAQRQGRRTTRNQVAIFAGYSSTSGHVDNTLGALRSAGYAEGRSEDVRITESGLAALGDFDPLPTGEDLRRYWLQNAGGKAERAMLAVILEAYPEPLTRDQVAEAAQYSVASGHVDNTLGRLRSLDLIQGPGTAIRASEDLFA